MFALCTIVFDDVVPELKNADIDECYGAYLRIICATCHAQIRVCVGGSHGGGDHDDK